MGKLALESSVELKPGTSARFSAASTDLVRVNIEIAAAAQGEPLHMMAADVANLMTGNLYVNVHSNNCQICPAGEIRGQLLPAP